MTVPLAILGGAGLVFAFVSWLAGPPFAGYLLLLVLAASIGPFLFTRAAQEGSAATVRRALLHAALLGGAGALGMGALALLRGGPLWASLCCGAFAGLYAYALGAWADLLRGGIASVLVALVGLLLISTLFWWDAWFLHGAASRKASVSWAFHLNPAAAGSITLGFDWLHAKALYSGNQTAESVHGVPLSGLSIYAAKTAALALLATGLGWWRRGA